MKPVAESFGIEKNQFTKWLFPGFTLLSLWAFVITLNNGDKNKWICLGGFVFFGIGYWWVLKSRIEVYQDGFTEHSLFKSRHVLWKDITSLSYETAYHAHGVQLNLIIKYSTPQKETTLGVKQYKKHPMQRFFEILYDQCPLAQKNDHFIKQATGEMKWKDKLKMY